MAVKAASILALSGSLRRGSFNTALLREADKLAPSGVSLIIHDLSDIPFYDEDVWTIGFPDSVKRLREAITKSDALLFATPEYNYSVSAVLKNAIDRCSRPPEQPFDKKPAAIIGASVGLFGTVRAQAHLRQTCASLNMTVLNKPEVLVASAKSKFDDAGNLTDETARGLLKEAVAGLVRLADDLRR